MLWAVVSVRIRDSSGWCASRSRTARQPTLGETDVTLKRSGPGRGFLQLVRQSEFCPRHRGRRRGVFVGTINDGIYAFGPGEGAVRRLGEKELPSAAVESLAYHAGKLYAGLAGGYLVTLEEKPRDLKVLASSRRKEKLSPFDDLSSGFAVPFLCADPSRDRLMFVLYENTNQDLYQVGPKKNSPSGLWELNVKSGTFSRRVRLYNHPRPLRQRRRAMTTCFSPTSSSLRLRPEKQQGPVAVGI